ncbi:MAG: hypothetical protein IT547_02890 [Hyphomonadaceae bacterium]|nr:hypothetical protein [Hyphomonadaceae bacterium]
MSKRQPPAHGSGKQNDQRKSISSDEQVGYGRPPAAHRFRPGLSGNPSGRQRGSRNLRTDLSEELSEMITVQEAGQMSRLTKQRALVKRLCAQSLSGDHRAMAQVVGLVLRLLPSEASAEDHNGALLEEDDEAIIQRYLTRAQRGPSTARAKLRGRKD